MELSPPPYNWEVVEIVRRVILTALIVVIGEYVKGFDLVIGSLCAFIFVGLQLLHTPYENKSLQYLQTVSLVDQYLVIFCFMLMSIARGSEEWDTEMVGYTLVCVQVLLLVRAYGFKPLSSFSSCGACFNSTNQCL